MRDLAEVGFVLLRVFGAAITLYLASEIITEPLWIILTYMGAIGMIGGLVLDAS